MRQSGKWMTIWDDRILELIDDRGAGNPSALADHENIRVSSAHVSRRLGTLADHGLLEKVGPGVYVLTDDGEKYLAGDVDAEDLATAGA
jgi:Mn-dependent DtxR family transcriptional regulator